MIAALFVEKDGPYFGLNGIIPWDESRDARTYRGPHPVIAHPPCQRWGRYWGGGPMLHGTKDQKLLGEDQGCFAHSLWAVRTFGGILEHPEASHAFRFYSLPIPDQKGGWSEPDRYGGRSCCVAQGHYGHEAQKLTWLYSTSGNYPDLIWGKCKNKKKIDESFRSTEERRKALERRKPLKRLNHKERILTPIGFRNLLIYLVTVSERYSHPSSSKD